MVGVMTCFLIHDLTIFLSFSTSERSTQGSYNIIIAPCSMLCNHLSLGTNLQKEEMSEKQNLNLNS